MRKLAAIAMGSTLILGGGRAFAKQEQKPHEDQGRHLAKGHHKFDANDREIANRWCVEHRQSLPIGFRSADRLTPQFESRLRVGVVLDTDLRRLVHPVPSDLLHRLPPPPVDLHDIAIGGHVGMLDNAHRLHDLLPLPPMP
jgi:hypothetical protein